MLLTLPIVAQSIGPDEVRVSSRPYLPQSQILHAEARLVRIDAVVRDNKGRIVSGLKPENFTIFDDGKKQTVATFEVQTHTPLAVLQANAATPLPAAGGQRPATQPTANGTPHPRPRYVALYFDDLHTKSGDMRHVQLAAENFIRTGLSAGDQIALFTAASSVTVDFTADASQVLDALANLRSRARVFDSGTCPRITPHDAYMIANFPNSDAYRVALAAADQCNCEDQANDGPTCYEQQERLVLIQAKQIWEPMKELSENTLETIQGVVDYLAKKPGERVLVLASSGFLTGTLEVKVDEVMDNALRSGIVVNALDAKGLYMEDPSHGRIQNELHGGAANQEAVHEAESFRPDLMSMTAAMADFAVGTGGRFFHDRNDLDAGFYSLAAAPETEYLLGFAPESEKSNGAYHKLKVEVNLPGKFDVQARPGYFAPTKETEEANQPSAEEKIDAEVRGSGEKSDFPLSIAEQARIANNGVHELSVQTRVDIHAMPFARQQNRRVDMLTFVAALFDAQGRMVTGKEAQMELALKPETFERFSKSGIDGGMSLEAPPGAYRLRVVVEEALRGEMSAMSRNVQVQ
ncbi:MAG TPA: VWA domain-containing protein [Candidatus Acidoferrales bacterium]|nr:VWA domain-containing protein [Candidatus Acidoferrales bacterium]